jgi:hypothetical protein
MRVQEVEEHLKSGKSVRVTLTGAKVVSTKQKVIAISPYKNVMVNSLVAIDPVYGPVYMSSSSKKITDAKCGDALFGKISLIGLGDKSEKYDTIMKFSKIIPGKAGEILIKKVDN